MIRITLGALANAQIAIGHLLALPLPPKQAYHVAKLARLVSVETTHFHDQRNALIRAHGADRPATPEELASGSDEQLTVVVKEKIPEFLPKLTALCAVEVEIAWSPVTLAMLGDHRVSGQDLLALGPLFDGEPTDLTGAVPPAADAPAG